MFVVDVGDRARLRDARIVDQGPRAAVGHLGALLQRLAAGRLAGDVQVNGAQGQAALGGLRYENPRLVLVACSGDHVPARGRETEHDHSAEPSGRPCHQHTLPACRHHQRPHVLSRPAAMARPAGRALHQDNETAPPR